MKKHKTANMRKAKESASVDNKDDWSTLSREEILARQLEIFKQVWSEVDVKKLIYSTNPFMALRDKP